MQDHVVLPPSKQPVTESTQSMGEETSNAKKLLHVDIAIFVPGSVSGCIGNCLVHSLSVTNPTAKPRGFNFLVCKQKRI